MYAATFCPNVAYPRIYSKIILFPLWSSVSVKICAVDFIFYLMFNKMKSGFPGYRLTHNVFFFLLLQYMFRSKDHHQVLAATLMYALCLTGNVNTIIMYNYIYNICYIIIIYYIILTLPDKHKAYMSVVAST
jgi:hypothetical protein